MTQPHDWPFEQPARGTLRPWYLTAAGYLAVLFPDGQEAQRAEQGLLQRGVLANDLRLYDAEEVLSITSRLDQERSLLAKTIAAVVSDAKPGNDTWATPGRGAGPCGCTPRPRTAPTNWLGSSPTTPMGPCATTATRASKTSMAAAPTDRPPPAHEPAMTHRRFLPHQPARPPAPRVSPLKGRSLPG